jgi:triosephosphate isomerase
MSKIIIANWKMNLSIREAINFVKKLKRTKNQIILAAPFTFLGELKVKLGKSQIKLAGQDVSRYKVGAYTGEISAKMLKEAGCSFCLVGHSERRIYFNEDDSQINEKIKNLLKYKIKPVLCIGENNIERKRGLTSKILYEQLAADLKEVKDPSRLLIAYEPIWAISTFQKGKVKKSASEKDIILAHLCIRNLLNRLYKERGKDVRILYGGTVNPRNSSSILGLRAVDGVLVGGASLKVSSFNAIIKSN